MFRTRRPKNAPSNRRPILTGNIAIGNRRQWKQSKQPHIRSKERARTKNKAEKKTAEKKYKKEIGKEVKESAVRVLLHDHTKTTRAQRRQIGKRRSW